MRVLIETSCEISNYSAVPSTKEYGNLLKNINQTLLLKVDFYPRSSNFFNQQQVWQTREKTAWKYDFGTHSI